MFVLPELPFEKSAVSPIITEEGFDYHHGKHHQTYVNNLNQLVADTPWAEKNLTELIVASHQQRELGLYNNAAQHYNHSFFWNCLSPQGGGQARGELLERIVKDFGSFESFKETFSNTAVKLFGSGWAWLALNAEDQLEIIGLKDADSPLILDKKPVLTLDVWEHAYYIDHRNARPQFVEGFWDIVNWEFANENLK